MRVLLTTCHVPRWASDQSWWDKPPFNYAPGYQPFYPVAREALDDYGRLGEFLARHFAGRVQAIECWNEPNLWCYLYPQRTADDPNFGARQYYRMLRAFTAGVRRAGTRVKVVAGATAPVGMDDRYRTSPQRFARFLKAKEAGRWFDVYSHHPYTPGGSLYPAPDQPPNDPAHTVTLYNLGVLLRTFPRKPFYLTEYGYNTKPSVYFGGFTVGETTQARYLKLACAYAGRYSRVKALFWYLVQDVCFDPDHPQSGVYTGLRRVDGTRKPSWYAFRQVAQ